ncbi:MAG: hypothetical protein M3R00_10225, partial [Pseudomonadota bacterium]|nr:hypothetical protein [Pseudomonadota bacterium]
CTQYTNDLITKMQAETAKLRSKLNSQIKWSSNDQEKTTELINCHELKIQELERIADYLKEIRSEILSLKQEPTEEPEKAHTTTPSSQKN